MAPKRAWRKRRRVYQRYPKEAIIIVLDVGKCMHNNQSSSSVLEEAKKCLSSIVRSKIILESRDEIALILFGTYPSPGEKRDEYTNVSIVRDFCRAEWDLIDCIHKIKETSISSDSIRAEALLTAINCLWEATYRQKRKYKSSKILFISNFNRFIGCDKVDNICRRLKEYNIGLNIIGPKAFTAEDFKLALDQTVPKGISTILREVKGESYSFNDARHTLTKGEIRGRFVNSWHAYLELGVLEKSKISIPIRAWIKTFERKHKQYWKNAYAHNPEARIIHKMIYLVNDVTMFSSDQSSLTSNYQEQISAEDVISAYRFGTSLVPFSYANKINMHFDPGERGIKILGFTKNINIPQYLYAAERTMYVFAQNNDKGLFRYRKKKRRRKRKHGLQEPPEMQLAAFIQALHDTEMMAICRLVYTQRSCPKIGILAPKITENYECLIFIALPFKEDIHHLEFPSLDSKSENIPTDEQLNAVDELIYAMDLTKNESGEESLKPKKTPNPYIQRLLQCLEFRAMNPHKPLPKTTPDIEALINPSPELLNRAENPIKRIRTLFQMKTSEKGQYTRIFKKEPADDSVPEEKLSLETDLVDVSIDKITEVGSINPVRDFQYMVLNSILPFDDICDQLMNVVFKYLQKSIECAQLKKYYSKILSICKTFRHTSLQLCESDKYNFFMKNLKNLLLDCEDDLWDEIKREQISLISNQELRSSTVSVLETESFLESLSESEEDEMIVDECIEIELDDYDMMLDQL